MMVTPTQPAMPAVTRLSRLAELTEADELALMKAVAAARVTPRRGLLGERHRGSCRPMLVVGGIAARARLLPDGRRQFLSLYLPGDLIEESVATRGSEMDMVTALTDVTLCVAPPAESSASLARAYAASRDLHQTYLLDSIARLGRLSARERLSDLLLELRERLDLAGLVEANGFDLPLLQEQIADTLGLTGVHVNRTLREMRLNGDLLWQAGRMELNDPADLARRVGRPVLRQVVSYA